MHIRLLTAFLMAGFLLTGADGPRTPEGRPDFSGTYDIATLTPLVRPAHYGERLSLTDAEAKAIAKAAADRMAKSNVASDPNRKAPPAGGDGSEGAAGNVGGYNTLWIDPGAGAFKLDGQWRVSIITDPKNGRMPEMVPAAAKRAGERLRMNRPNQGDAWWIKAGITPGPYDDPELRPLGERCLLGFGSSAGPPALPVLYNNLKQIVQTKDHIMILNEMVHDTRIIRMNSKHEPPDVRRWLGDSIGRWEGDTLIVDTTNFTDKPALASATKELHVVERFTRLDAKTLLYKFTVEDPSVWTKPWSGEYVWPVTENRIYEYACHEGNYSFGNILRGARLLEAEALAAKPAAPTK
ncbi:MAG: hypothetical protein HYZ37_06910 [Candidatus Solibacter usitatus]|nr:hypothetical protein [Candidatus Solibacter usitatus]